MATKPQEDKSEREARERREANRRALIARSIAERREEHERATGFATIAPQPKKRTYTPEQKARRRELAKANRLKNLEAYRERERRQARKQRTKATEEQKEKRRAYQRQWLKDHPEIVAERNRKKREKYAQQKGL